MLIATNQQKLLAYIVGGGAGLNIVLNTLLIPAFSYKGAAIATVASELFAFLLCSLTLSKLIAPSPLFTVYKKPLLGVLIMGAFIVIFDFLPITALILLAAIVYIAALLIMRTFDQGDQNLLKQVLKGKLLERST
jgi:O-antigen/teichoic acid export membrane protein